MGITFHLGDCVKWARDYSGPLFHALFCDAPYEMEFMGKDWDGSGVAFDPETWRALARVLYPGAFLMVFAGTINDDLISVAMRSAGLRKFHKMMGWVYGSGFPKASRIDTQIDKAAGAEREIVKVERHRDLTRNGRKGDMLCIGDPASSDINYTAPATPLAQAWEGHRYGLQALKPAIETVLIFQKPYDGKPIDNITQTGAGALNIEGGRIGVDPDDPNHRRESVPFTDRDRLTYHKGLGGRPTENLLSSGRWPANFFLDSQAASRLDEMSGERKSGGSGMRTGTRRLGFAMGDQEKEVYNDTGGASRFFFQISDRLDEADPVSYQAKSSSSEREAGLLGHVVCSSHGKEGVIHETDPLHSKSHYTIEDGEKRVGKCRRNSHTTVKPLSLSIHLATLLLPPAEYAPRRIVIPFSGAGSEAIGAALAGWEEIEGIELKEEYVPISRARAEYWLSRPKHKNGKKKGIAGTRKDLEDGRLPIANPNQLALFEGRSQS